MITSRSPLVPGVRPIGEVVPGFEIDAWFGLFVSSTFLGPEAFSKRVEQETQRWGDIVREQKLQKE